MDSNAQTTTPTAVREMPAKLNQELSLEPSLDLNLELEQENARLHKLVADLLVRNQQLRLELKVAQRVLTS